MIIDFFLTAKIKRNSVLDLLKKALEQETGKKVEHIKFDITQMSGNFDGITVTFAKEKLEPID